MIPFLKAESPHGEFFHLAEFYLTDWKTSADVAVCFFLSLVKIKNKDVFFCGGMLVDVRLRRERTKTGVEICKSSELCCFLSLCCSQCFFKSFEARGSTVGGENNIFNLRGVCVAL